MSKDVNENENEIETDPGFAVEDEFGERNCWCNGFRGEGHSCNLGSYMTIMDYPKLETAWLELPGTRPKVSVEQACDYFECTAYLSPSIGMFAGWLRRKIEAMT